jgi:hypothetical protein
MTLHSRTSKLRSTRFEPGDVLETQLSKQRAATIDPGRCTAENLQRRNRTKTAQRGIERRDQTIAPKLHSTRFEPGDVLKTQLSKQRAATIDPGRCVAEKSQRRNRSKTAQRGIKRRRQTIATKLHSRTPKRRSTHFEPGDVLETELSKQKAATIDPGRCAAEKLQRRNR